MFERISPREFSLWSRHLAEYPLGEDRRLHYIVSAIWVLLMKWSGASKQGESLTIYDVAPWLESNEIKKKKLEIQEKKAEATTERLTGMMYGSWGIYEFIDPSTIPVE